MGLFGKKKDKEQKSSSNYTSDPHDDYSERLAKLHDKFIEGDFIYLCSRVEHELDFYVELFEGKPVEEVHTFIESNQNLNLREKFLSTISIYDELTSTQRLNDIRRPFTREDIDGYRYNDFDWVVCYPKRVYDEKRKEFLQYYQKLKPYVLCEQLLT